MGFFRLILLGILVLAPLSADAAIRIATLQFGTVNWQLDVIRHHKLDKKYGFEFETVPVASKNAAAVSLQGGGSDIIVGDWFWVARNISEGKSYTFAPYSLAAGGVITPPNSSIKTVADLAGKKLGIAGGKIDKSWLLVRAYGLFTLGTDLVNKVQPVYGAPPLLSGIFERGEIDAVLTFWHYQALLLAKGNKRVLGVKRLMEELDVPSNVPINGWIFDRKWAEENRQQLSGFLRATREANRIMATSDAEWQRLKPLMHKQQQQALKQLKTEYRKGVPQKFGEEEVQGAEKLFELLRELGGSSLVGRTKKLPPLTFWAGSYF